jgi:hypothetical protein
MSNEFWQEVESLIKPIPRQDIEYRVYYDKDGEINLCTMTGDTKGDYLVVTRDEYASYFQYRVVKGKLVKIDNDAGYRVQLAISREGFPVVRGHAGLLIEEDEKYNDREYYARTN